MTKFARKLTVTLLACLSWASIAGAEEAPRWIVDADAPGPDLPPVGRSLFDFLVAVEDGGETVLRVPYPFEDLIALAARHARETTTRPVQQVLIPLGRSLHRNAAHPDFFKSPRAVAVVEAEPLDPPDRPLMLLKDRLYLGYQPVTDSVEVISYNEAAGRFEFQVVADYRAGGAPTVYYTDRAVCIGCHQNHAPIFAGEPWEESNSNPKIGALLELEQPSFYGIPSFTGIDIPGLIGNAIDRANMFAAHQLLWREGCGEGADGITCRANVFLSVLRYRLAGQRRSVGVGDGRKRDFQVRIKDTWRALWPNGLALPTRHIRDRDPLEGARYNVSQVSVADGLRDLQALMSPDLATFDDAFEPAYPRPPLEVWTMPRPIWSFEPANAPWADRMIDGLAGFLAPQDIARLDHHLYEGAAQDADRSYRSDCAIAVERTDGVEALAFACSGDELDLEGRAIVTEAGVVTGRVTRLRVGEADPLGELEMTDGETAGENRNRRVTWRLRQPKSGLRARLTDGSALATIELVWASGAESARARVTVLDDATPLAEAVAWMARETEAGRLDAFAAKPFRRAGLMAPLFDRLGLAAEDWCCANAAAMPPPRAGPPL